MDQFTRTNPFVFPVRVAADLICDGTEEASKTCQAFGGTMENIANTTPVVGHLNGVGHAIYGNADKGFDIYLKATRSTTVTGAGVGDFFLGRPAGAALLASETGTLWDGSRLAIDDRTDGTGKLVKAAGDGDSLTPGKVFDSIATPICDGAAGVLSGKTANSIAKSIKKNKLKAQVEHENQVKQRQMDKIANTATTKGVDNSDKLVENVQNQANDLKQKVQDNET